MIRIKKPKRILRGRKKLWFRSINHQNASQQPEAFEPEEEPPWPNHRLEMIYIHLKSIIVQMALLFTALLFRHQLHSEPRMFLLIMLSMYGIVYAPGHTAKQIDRLIHPDEYHAHIGGRCIQISVCLLLQFIFVPHTERWLAIIIGMLAISVLLLLSASKREIKHHKLPSAAE